MTCRNRIAICLCLAWLGLASPASTQTLCAGSLISVAAQAEAAVARVCGIVARAQARFDALGLALTEPVRITVTETLDTAPGHCVALYNTASNELQVLPEHCLEGRPGRLGFFPEMPADVLFDSLIVHELTHAHIDQAGGAARSRLAHEYLAYALQLVALPPTERDRIVAEAGIDRPVLLSDFDEALLSFAPQRYAAMAWLHFSAAPDQRATVQGLLDGSVPFYSLRE